MPTLKSVAKSLFGRTPKKVESSRVSDDDPLYFHRQNRVFGLLSPDEVGKVIPKSLTLKEIKNMSASQLVRTIIGMSSDADAAVNAWQSHIASPYSLKASDTKSKTIIENLIKRMELGGTPFQSDLETAAYNRYVEGGLLAELYADDQTGEFVDIALPPPFSLRYRKRYSGTHNSYYQVGQGNIETDYKVLQDKENPNPLVEWAPTRKYPDKPFGRSQIASNIFGTVSILELVNMIMEYVRGQAFPKGVASIPRQPLAAMGYSPQQVTQIANEAREKVEKAISESDLSQALVTSTEVLYTIFGAMGRSNLDASEMIVHMFEQSLRRGYKLPRAIYGGTGERGGSFGEYGERVEWQAFDRLVKSERGVISSVYTNLFRVVLRDEGSMGECELMFDPTDLELERIQAEKSNIEFQGYSTLIKDQVVSPQEIRARVKQDDPRFADLEDEMVGEPMMQPQLQPPSEETDADE